MEAFWESFLMTTLQTQHDFMKTVKPNIIFCLTADLK